MVSKGLITVNLLKKIGIKAKLMQNQQVNTQIFSLFCLYFLFSCSSIIVPESNFLEDAKVTPANLEYLRDSIRFEIEGKILVESVMIPRDPIVRLEMRSPEKKLALGELELQKGFDAYRFKKAFTIPYEQWMDASLLELQFNQGEKNLPEPDERKILARGIITTPLMAKVGKVYPNEPIPDVGLYIPTGVAAIDMSRSKVFEVLYKSGSSKLDLTPSNVEVIENLKTFITENPSIISLRITGIQSPETSEGKNSRLGRDRADNLYQYLAESGLMMRDSLTEVKSRWNDWFDFRLLLRDYSKISTQRKDEYYSVLLSGAEFLNQAEQLKKISGFSTVSRDLYPRLRAAKIEIEAKPLPGLDQKQALELREILDENKVGKSLDLGEWSVAGEFSPRLQDKEAIYSKMTELFRSALPYNNLAVVKMRMAQRTLDPEIKSKLWEEAKGLLSQASRLETSPYVLHNQAQIMILEGDYWDAYKKLSDASILTKNEDFLKMNESLRGALDIIRGDYKLATLRFDYPYTQAKDYFNKGLAYFLAKDYANATLSFEESVIADREYGYGYYGLAMVASKNAQKEVAIIQLKKAIDTNELIYQRALIDPVFEEIRSEQAFFDIFRQNIFQN
jgi:outer membrane protein OmpA-like peptidoglycan-associated protein